MKAERKETAGADKKVLAFFLIMVPTILIVAMGMINPEQTWWVMIGLMVFQSIILKQFLDNYYGPFGLENQ